MVRQSSEARYLILKFLVFKTEFQDNALLVSLIHNQGKLIITRL